MLQSASQMAEPKPLPGQDPLLARIRSFASRRVVVVADLVVDRFISGTPKRISREAPVLILRFEGERLVPGGGANALANLRALGGSPIPVGFVGNDESGRALLQALVDAGIPTAGILVREGYRTPTKTRILGGARHSIKQQIVRYDIEDELEVRDAEMAQLRTFLDREARGAGAVVVSDYGYGSAHPAVLAALRPSLPAGAPILVDSRYRLAEFEGIAGATPNEEEAEALLGSRLAEALEPAAGQCRELARKLGIPLLLVTRGSRGMLLIDGPRVAQIPVHGTDQVADVTGAGDTVIATFALALAAGAAAVEAAVLANYAGGIVVMKMGTATASPAELERAVVADSIPREAVVWAAS